LFQRQAFQLGALPLTLPFLALKIFESQVVCLCLREFEMKTS